jgi:2',3'-cyclic-nucleotide 2'-phosphodiesterase (5'-nucleotidase family)
MLPRTLQALVAALPLALASCMPEAEPAKAAPREQDPAPRVRLRLTGHLEGHLEPCGCASGQVGGLARRTFRLLQDRSSYDFLIEGGDLTTGGTSLDELKLYTILNVLDDARARYDAVGLGPGDLALDPDLLAGFVESFPQLPFVCADLVPTDTEALWPFRAFVDLEEENVRARVTGLATRAPTAAEGAPSRLELLTPQDAWTRAMEGVAPDAFRILLHHGSSSSARRAASLDPKPDLIVSIQAEHAEPPRDPEFLEGGVPMVQPGVRGRFLLDVTLTRMDGQPRVTLYTPIPLEGSLTKKGALEDPDVRALVLAHRHEVKADGTRERMAELSPTANGASYVGNARCAVCHTEAQAVWEKTAHAKAWATLEEAAVGDRYGWPVPHYPDCVRCHTVGYGQTSGFVNPEKTPALRDVGCESCHGAGSAHAANPIDNRLGSIGAASCLVCHDFEQSPDFDYAERWKAIEHK